PLVSRLVSGSALVGFFEPGHELGYGLHFLGADAFDGFCHFGDQLLTIHVKALRRLCLDRDACESNRAADLDDSLTTARMGLSAKNFPHLVLCFATTFGPKPHGNCATTLFLARNGLRRRTPNSRAAVELSFAHGRNLDTG